MSVMGDISIEMMMCERPVWRKLTGWGDVSAWGFFYESDKTGAEVFVALSEVFRGQLFGLDEVSELAPFGDWYGNRADQFDEICDWQAGGEAVDV